MENEVPKKNMYKKIENPEEFIVFFQSVNDEYHLKILPLSFLISVWFRHIQIDIFLLGEVLKSHSDQNRNVFFLHS